VGPKEREASAGKAQGGLLGPDRSDQVPPDRASSERAQSGQAQSGRAQSERAQPGQAQSERAQPGPARSAQSGRAHPQALTRIERVRRRPEYQAIYEHGSRASGRLMTVFVLPNGRDHVRLGIAATRKLGGAVERNRTKRLVREAFRRNKLQAGLDIVVIPRREMLEADYAHVEADFLAILKRRGTRRRSAP
jgi:ribonuclease P protein component